MQPTFEPDSVYFASGAYGSTVAKAALRSPRKAYDVINGIDRPKSDAMRFGTLWDTWVTGDRRTIVVRPATYHDPKTGQDKPWHASSAVCKQWLAEHQGYAVISQDDADRLQRMSDRMGPLHRLCIPPAQFQAVYRIDQGSFRAQCKVDILLDDGHMVDVKTTSSPIEDFARQAIKYGYHVQAGWYRWIAQELGYDAPNFTFLVTETISPYRTIHFIPDTNWLVFGDAEASRAVAILDRCCRENAWHDPQPITQTLSLPHWLNKED